MLSIADTTKLWLASALLAFLVSLAHAGDTLSVAEFAKVYIEQAKKAEPKLSFKSTDTETFDVTMSDGSTVDLYIGNAYREYQSSPEALDAIIGRHVQALLQSSTGFNDADLSPDIIVPIVRRTDYLDALAHKPGFDREQYITEQLAPGLIVLYAFDLPQTIRAVMREDLKDLKLKPSDLGALARKNLMRLYGKTMSMGGENGLFFFANDTTYESSMILLDIWTKQNFPVKGEIVVFVPGRNYLLVTGSEEEDGPRIGRQVSDKIIADGAYTMISHPLVWRGGRWQLFR